MDPRLMKLLLNQRIMAPAEEIDGGGDEEEEVETEESEEESEEGDEDGDEDEDEESEDDEEEDDEDEESDEEEEESDEEESEDDEEESDEESDREKLGRRAQKRINKLIGEKKDLKRQLEEAQRTSGKDGEAIISAARKAGVLPHLMTKELANGLEELDKREKALKYFSGLLDSDDDEFTIGEKEYSRRQLEREESKLKDEIREIKGRFGNEQSKVLKETKAIFELGLAAQKAGWKPGAKTEKKKKIEKPTKGKKPKPAKAKSGRVDWSDVEDEEGLEAAIVSMNRRRK